ncbi:HAD family hydrolase [Patescibacteria group bacterium]|nr:HAD family hydrolase [Patescibacteria group bacterium]
MIKAVLFDFDGTLADTLPFYIKAYDVALRSVGFVLDEKEIAQKCFGKSEYVICNSLGIPEKTELFAQAYFSAVKDLFKHAPLFNDTIEVLNFLKDRNTKIIVITFAYRWYIDQMMGQYKLEPYFDFVISTDDVVSPKPHPEAVLKAIEKLKITAKETLVVGDSKSDILMGKAAGSKTVLFTRKEYDLFYSFEELKKTNPDFIVSNLDEVKKLVL